MLYDLIIIGAGPAGTAAAVYAASSRILRDSLKPSGFNPLSASWRIAFPPRENSRFPDPFPAA